MHPRWPLIGFTFSVHALCRHPSQQGTAVLLLTGNGSARLENVKLMQMEDSERHKTCDCMVSNWVSIFFPAFCKNIWNPRSTVVILDINAGVKVSDILLDTLRDKFVLSLEKMQRSCCSGVNEISNNARVNLRIGNVLRINRICQQL